jgi:hypothetical protein
MFNYVTCANYTFEIWGWLLFSIAVQVGRCQPLHCTALHCTAPGSLSSWLKARAGLGWRRELCVPGADDPASREPALAGVKNVAGPP